MTELQVGAATNAGLTINGREFSWLWLADHSQNEPLYHLAGRQRLFETFIADSPGAADVNVVDNTLSLTWPNGATATYPATFFNAIDAPAEAYQARSHPAVPWDSAAIADRVVHLAFRDFIDDDDVLASALAALGTEGLVLIDDLPLDRDATRQAFERIGFIRKTLFGELWNLRSDGEFDDTGSTPLDITPHTDGTYLNDAPGFLGLHCLEFDAEGGNNVLVDGFHLAELIRTADPEAFRTLSTVDVPGRYIGDGGHLIARRPLLLHDHGSLVQVSYNNHDRAPLWLPPQEMAELYRALGVFDEVLRDPMNQFEFGLRPGSMVLFDNWRTLHGRRSFTGNRHVIGGYLNRQEYESAVRRLAQQPLDLVV